MSKLLRIVVNDATAEGIEAVAKAKRIRLSDVVREGISYILAASGHEVDVLVPMGQGNRKDK
jgi:hypothetical protein